MKLYKIRNKETGKFISNYTDHSDREGYIIGSFGLTPDGELVFFEATDGGMDEVKCPNLEAVFTPITNEDNLK